MTQPQRPPRGRGTASNPHNRFAATRSEAEHDGWYEEATPLTFTTAVRQETAKTVISRNQSPDVGFDRSVNPYRGCEHGCISHAIRHFCSNLRETQSQRGFEWYGNPSSCLKSQSASGYPTP